MKLQKLGKTALDFGINILPLEQFYDGINWSNGKSYDEELTKKLNSIMNEIYEKYPSRVIISFKATYPSLSSRCIQIRRAAGYGDDVVSFFADFGFHYDMGTIAYKLAEQVTEEKEKFDIEPFGLALNPLSDFFDGLKWIAKSGKFFDEESQKKINYILDKVYEWYPNRMIYLLNKNHSKFCEGTLLKTRRLTGYNSNEELFNDFGFEYLNQSQLAAVKSVSRPVELPKKEIAPKVKKEKPAIVYPIIKIDENGVLLDYQTDIEEVIIPKEVKIIKSTSIKPNGNLKITFEEGCDVIIENMAFNKTKPYSVDFSNCKNVTVKRGGFVAMNEIVFNGFEKISSLERDSFNSITFNENNYKYILSSLNLLEDNEPYYNIFTANYSEGALGYRRIYISKHKYNIGDIIGGEIIIGVSKVHMICKVLTDTTVLKHDFKTVSRNVCKDPKDIEFEVYDVKELEDVLAYLGYTSNKYSVDKTVKCIDEKELKEIEYNYYNDLNLEVDDKATLLEALIGINNNKAYYSYPQFINNDIYNLTFMKYRKLDNKMLDLYPHTANSINVVAFLINKYSTYCLREYKIKLTKEFYEKLLPKIYDKASFEFGIKDLKSW